MLNTSHFRRTLGVGRRTSGHPRSPHVPRPTPHEKGIALISVVVIMLTMALIGASLAELSSAVNYSVDNILDETKARYLAEAGIAYALHQLRSGADLSESIDKATGDPVYYPLGEGGYTVVFDPNESLITCTGIVNDVKKTLQLQYNVF